LIPNNFNFIKYIKLTAAIPINWITDEDEVVSTMEMFLTFKEKNLQQINVLGKSTKTVYQFLRHKTKI